MLKIIRAIIISYYIIKGCGFMNVVDHKCPNCNATLEFNPKNQKWDCHYCKSSFELKDLKQNEVKYEKANSKPLKDLDVYTCKNCGAKIMTDENTTATFCVYCKSTAIIKDRLVDAYEPNKIIPFKTTKEDAIEAFKNVGIRKIFMPREFKDKKNIQEMKGIYIPFWLFDFECEGNISGSATRVSSWSDTKYHYTKTDHYKVERGGSITFENVPVDGSKHFDNAIMNSIETFNYQDLCDFNYSYLSGFYAEKYNQTDIEVIKDGKKRTRESVLDILKSDLNRYHTTIIDKENVDILNVKVKYVLLPVWLLNIKYKNEIRPFAMNGQTGKMVGDIPIDKKKFIFSGIITIIIMIAITVGLFLIGGYKL